MFKLIQPKHRSLIGIDISSSAVTLLEISRKGATKPCVEAYGRESLPSSVFDGPVIKDIDLVTHSIKRLVAHTKITSKWAAIAVPDAAVMRSVVQIQNSLNDRELEELVILEVEQFIPYSIEEFHLDFQVMGPSIESPQLLDVLIIATKIENVDTRVNALLGAGLKPLCVDVESYAIERAFANPLSELSLSKTINLESITRDAPALMLACGLGLRNEWFGYARY